MEALKKNNTLKLELSKLVKNREPTQPNMGLSQLGLKKFANLSTGEKWTQSLRNYTLFIKHSDSRRVTILIICVDNVIVTENDENKEQRLSQCLAKEFLFKTLGKLKYLLIFRSF